MNFGNEGEVPHITWYEDRSIIFDAFDSLLSTGELCNIKGLAQTPKIVDLNEGGNTLHNMKHEAYDAKSEVGKVSVSGQERNVQF